MRNIHIDRAKKRLAIRLMILAVSTLFAFCFGTLQWYAYSMTQSSILIQDEVEIAKNKRDHGTHTQKIDKAV